MIACVSCHGLDREKSVATRCCSRFVCAKCMRNNPRMADYCVLCQLPIAANYEPPIYDDPPPYAPISVERSHKEGETSCVHYVRPSDTLTSLSLAYTTSARLLRAENHIYSDHLLQARSFIVIPGYSGPSLSPNPDKDEEDKVRLKKFMVATKCTDYEMAKVYVTSSTTSKSLEDAIARYRADSEWTRGHAKSVQGSSRQVRHGPRPGNGVHECANQ